MKIVVLGVGNILLSDEGAGCRVIELLGQKYRFPPQVEIIDGGTMGLELLPYLDDATHLFIIDAVSSEDPAGTLSRIELADPPAYFRTKISPHQIGLSELLAVASMEEILPGSIILFGIVPKNLSTGITISPEVEKNLPELARMVAVELETTGVSLDG